LEVDKCNNKGHEKNILTTMAIGSRCTTSGAESPCITTVAYLKRDKNNWERLLVGHKVKNHQPHPQKMSLVLGLKIVIFMRIEFEERQPCWVNNLTIVKMDLMQQQIMIQDHH
jgi:hypothetical protein